MPEDLQIRITTTADTTGAKQTAAALDDVNQAAQKTAKGTAELGKEADKTSGHFRGLGRAAYGFREIVGGIQYNRPIEFLRGLVNIVLGLGGAFVTTAAVIAGPLVAALLLMKKIANDNEKAMKDLWENATHQTKEYKDGVAAAKEESAKDLAAMLADVKALSAGYAELLGRMEAAEKRGKELAGARKELALAQADTPEKKAAVEATFGSAGLETEGLQAGVRKENSEAAIRQIDAVRTAAAIKTAKARGDRDDAVQRAGFFSPEADSPAARVARTQAAIADSRYKEAVENEKKVNAEAAPEISRAEKVIDESRTVSEVSAIKRQTLGLTTATSTAKSIDTGGQQAKLRATAESAQARGDFAAQDMAVAELRKLVTAGRQLTNAVINSGATTTDLLKKSAKDLEKLRQQQRNGRESGDN